MSIPLKNLPLGINTLAVLRENDCVYVDKTELAHSLARVPGRFFLSRPRRFGKSLFLDTLKEIFEGNQALFEGLYIHDKWDWSRTYPVIKIDFADGSLRTREELDRRIVDILRVNAERLGVALEADNDIPGMFAALIRHAASKTGQRVVVLVDEYDKPILDNIDNPAVAVEMREGLRNLYSVMKGQDANLQFIFMTGVTKFSKVTLFSGLNQLNDITIDATFSSICGYTDADLRGSFGAHLEGADFEEIRRWYNGYSWMGSETVYNPYDILLFIQKGRQFRNFWFETGSPSFLIKLFQKNRYFLPELENIEVTEEILDSFDVERIDPVTLLFQSGYLTIKETFTYMGRYMFRMQVPNQEVKIALADQFINTYTDLVTGKIGMQGSLYESLRHGDLSSMTGVVKRLFAGIPWRNFTNNALPESEGYYASVLYAFFASLDATVIPEDITNHGQVDMTVMLGAHIYVMEIKVVDGETVEGNPALAQVLERGYADKYRGESGKTVHEVGLVFSRASRNLLQADWQ